MKRQRRWPGIVAGLLAPVVFAAGVLVFFTALNHLDSGRKTEGRTQLEQSLRRASAACYAAEGIYPPDLAYLEEHYGVQVDEDRYTVDYRAFASNLMPDITVLETRNDAKKPVQHHMEGLLVLLLFGVFAACILSVR